MKEGRRGERGLYGELTWLFEGGVRLSEGKGKSEGEENGERKGEFGQWMGVKSTEEEGGERMVDGWGQGLEGVSVYHSCVMEVRELALWL